MTRRQQASWTGATVSFEGTPLRLGITTPVLTMLPDNHARWEGRRHH